MVQGMVIKIYLTNARRPALGIIEAFQLGRVCDPINQGLLALLDDF
jgi:hypothetical protein